MVNKTKATSQEYTMNINSPVLLIILDGFGHAGTDQPNAILEAQKPHLDYFFDQYPHTFLTASGTAVGLLDGMMGNSQVGHLTIGAGRIIQQPVTQLHTMIQDKSFFSNKVLVQQLQHIQKSGHSLHILGLLSNAGVHCTVEDIIAYVQAAVEQGIYSIFVHPFLDGRDTPARSAALYLQQLQDALSVIGHGTIGSLHGRFYAMDRDQNWQRTQISYDVLTQETQPRFLQWQDALAHSYLSGESDEFVYPTLLSAQAIIKPYDSIIHANFRPDRARQLTESFITPTFNSFPHKILPITSFITPVHYGAHLHTHALLPRPVIHHTLKQELLRHNKTFFAVAETEKYATVTYFFNGGDESIYEHETRILIPSLRCHDYSRFPCMSAKQITQAILDSLTTSPYDFYLINYANADMVGHSGNFKATVQAIECLDSQLGHLYDAVIKHLNGTMIITADHGNAEALYNTTTFAIQPNTAHTTNPVPFIVISAAYQQNMVELPVHALSDIAPFILQSMKLPIPLEMRKGR
jgi:2,3-bisphosphoglycerate-independent phosphoglycerate mutase